MLKNIRPDDLLVHAIKATVDSVSNFDRALLEDVVVGCAMPEAEQGLNMARNAALMAGLPVSIPGTTINRFCASGLDAVNIAASRIASGEIDCALAGGAESMSLVPSGGNRIAFNPALWDSEAGMGTVLGMGLTAEKVAKQWSVSRADQDAFALESHRRAVVAQQKGEFADEIAPFLVSETLFDAASGTSRRKERRMEGDEGPRADSTLEALAKLRPVFATDGTITAGNSSQMSDGAAAVLLVSERFLKQHNLTPLARFVGYAAAGVDPDVMGIGPIKAIPKLLARVGIAQGDVDWFELNEAFAAQSLAIIRELGLDAARVNPLGGAIALGHPLGATGSIRTATLVHGLRRHRKRFGMVTMCVGGGMGVAGLFEAL
jgi:acetyl-CoA acyltransferase